MPVSALYGVYVDLEKNKIGAEGAKALSDTLRINNTLKGLYLDSNELGVIGGGYIASALLVNSGLNTLCTNLNRS